MEAGESTVWKTLAQNKEGQDELIVLKQVRKEAFASEEEMQASQKFYSFLKNFPGLGKFIPDTLYFKARVTSDSNPQAFRLQHFIEGKPADKLKDEELYADPAVIRQLLEFIDIAIELLHTARENKTLAPDLMRTPEFSNTRVMLGGLLADPRYSSNIFISNEPDKNGQRVFFVDTAANVDERTKKLFELFSRYVISHVEEYQLKRWKNNLEGILQG